MNPQYEEHMRDSAPDASRFDGFDRGDLSRQELVIIDDLVDDEARLRDHDKLSALVAAHSEVHAIQCPHHPAKPSLASRLMARLGAFRAGFREAVADQRLSLARFVQHSNPDRNAERAICRELGKRQY